MLRFAKITLAVLTVLASAGLAACTSGNTAAGSTISIAASIEASAQTTDPEQKTIYGQAASIGEKSLTIAIGTLNDTSAASGSANTDLLTLTGETLTLTVTDATLYSSEAPGRGSTPQAAPDTTDTSLQADASSQTVSFRDIAADSILKVTYNTRTSEAVSVTILKPVQ